MRIVGILSRVTEGIGLSDHVAVGVVVVYGHIAQPVEREDVGPVHAVEDIPDHGQAVDARAELELERLEVRLKRWSAGWTRAPTIT